MAETSAMNWRKPMIGNNVSKSRKSMAETDEIMWARLLWPTVLVSGALLILPQSAFIIMSFYHDMGLGMIGDTFTLANYVSIVTDEFYLSSIWQTVRLSFIATTVAIIFAFPTAYTLTRVSGGLASVLLSLLIVTSLVTIVVKVLGLNILLGSSGLINSMLLFMGVVSSPLALINNEVGVVIGLIQYTLPILVLMLFSVVQSIPESLEEAAAIHGATRFSILRNVLLPLSKPGLLAGALISFNMCMGAFTSAVLLGGGHVRTLPVLIENKLMENADYAMGAALSTFLLVLVFLVNLMAAGILMRTKKRKQHA